MTEKHDRKHEALKPFLAHLRALPFVDDAAPDERGQARREGKRIDGLLRIRTPKQRYRLFYELKRTNIGYTTADGVIAQAKRHPEHPWILFAPYIPRPMGEYLAAAGLNFVDEVGNCRLELGADHVAVIEGRRREKPNTAGQATGPAAVEVAFAFLAKPDLMDAPVRNIAKQIGAGKTAVANALQQLIRQGLITEKKPRRVLRPKELLDRWLIGYETIVRPRRMVGRYKTLEPDPLRLEERTEEILGEAGTQWGWTGGAAAMKLTGFYRGVETVLAADQLPENFFKELRALPAQDGNFTVLKAAGNLAFEGVQEHTVHPLLVFAELRIAGHERAGEAAEEVRHRYLEYLA